MVTCSVVVRGLGGKKVASNPPRLFCRFGVAVTLAGEARSGKAALFAG